MKKIKKSRQLINISILLIIHWIIVGCANLQPLTKQGEDVELSSTVQNKKVSSISTEVPSDSYGVAVAKAIDPLSPKRLVLAARYGHDDVVQFLLDNQVTINARDSRDYTALIAAAEGGYYDVVKKLIVAKADVNAKTSSALTALMSAAANGDTVTMIALLNAGANVDDLNNEGESPLFYAVRNGHLEATQILLDHDADPNRKNTQAVSASTSGYTPLMYVADHAQDMTDANWEGLASLLLSKNAQPNLRNKRGESALSIAQRRSDSSLKKILQNAGARMERAYTSLSEDAALIKAARMGDIEKIETLIDQGTNPDVKNRGGMTPLLAATFNNQLGAVKILIAKGADVNLVPVGFKKWAFAASAASLKDHELMESASKGDTALLVAVRKGHSKIVEYLIASGADVRFANRRGDMPIFVAAVEGQPDIVDKLLAAGVGPDTLEIEKLTVSMTNALEVMGRNTPLIAAAQAGHRGIVQILLKWKANPNHQGFLNKTALLWAVERGYIPVVDVLLAAGAEANLHDIEGLSPLMAAARNGNERLTYTLLKYNADPNLTQQADVQGRKGKAFATTGMTTLIYAARGGHNKIVKLLIEAGSNVNAISRNGETALKEASINGYPDIVDLLTVAGAQ
ncbi:MAG: hypothetical protein GXP14_04485 [Gammaproteobacteria bacterium]|nr:hypothetical protein [Gammaproteobacteria bacterium]